MEWFFTLSGFFAGLVVGAVGVGGGALMTPLLILAFGVPPAMAVGTDLLYASLTKFSGSVVHGLQGTVEWRVVGLLSLGSLPATIAALLFLRLHVSDGHHLALVTSTALGIGLILSALSVLAGSLLKARDRKEFASIEMRGGRRAVLTMLLGGALGILVTLSSVGAGAVGIVLLLLLYPRIEIPKVVGTDIAHAVPLTLVAGLGHASMGNVDYGILGSLLLGSIPGILLGSRMGSRIPEKILRSVLATILVFVGGRMLLV